MRAVVLYAPLHVRLRYEGAATNDGTLQLCNTATHLETLVKVLALVVHIGEPEPAEVHFHGARAKVGIVNGQLGLCLVQLSRE
eukprot:5862942-Pyramimonas_sp.AAC.1